MKKVNILLFFMFLLIFSCKGLIDETKRVNIKKMKQNPLENAKVGDFVTYRIVNEINGLKSEMTLKETILEKSSNFVVIRKEYSSMGIKMPPQDTKISLKKTYLPYIPSNIEGVDVKEIEKNMETLNLNGRNFLCERVKVEVRSPKSKSISTSSVWSSSEVPLYGLVKMITESDVEGKKVKTKMELIGFGR